MILGIETSVEHVGVALGDYRGVRAHSMLASDRRHAESLTPMIQFVMQQAEVEMSDLSAVAVDVGPGLFTGMRVGIAAAQSIAWALELPMIPVCSLDVVAMNAHWSESVVAASLDARRGEVYWALYRMRAIGAEPQRITEPVVSSPEDLAVHLADRGEEIVCVGSGFDRTAQCHAIVQKVAVTHFGQYNRVSFSDVKTDLNGGFVGTVAGKTSARGRGKRLLGQKRLGKNEGQTYQKG